MSEHRCPYDDEAQNLEPGEKCWRCGLIQQRTLEDIIRQRRGSDISFGQFVGMVVVLVGGLFLFIYAQDCSFKEGRFYEACLRAGGNKVVNGGCFQTSTSSMILDAGTVWTVSNGN